MPQGGGGLASSWSFLRRIPQWPVAGKGFFQDRGGSRELHRADLGVTRSKIAFSCLLVHPLPTYLLGWEAHFLARKPTHSSAGTGFTLPCREGSWAPSPWGGPCRGLGSAGSSPPLPCPGQTVSSRPPPPCGFPPQPGAASPLDTGAELNQEARRVSGTEAWLRGQC